MVRKERLKSWAISRFITSVSKSSEKQIIDRREADRRLDNLGTMAVVRAGFAGVISGIIVAGFALWLRGYEGNSGMDGWTFLFVISLVSGLVTGLELLFLYRDSLNTAARMAKVLGVPQEELEVVDEEYSIPNWLIYAALGAPGHRDVFFGIDPLAKIGKVGLLIRKALHKVRVAGSATIFKLIIRRMWVRLIGRVGTRAYVELLALPVFVVLNILGMRSMIGDMRSRLVGHELAPKLVEHAIPEGVENINSGFAKAIHRGFEEQIMAARFIHPNQIRFLNIIGHDWDDSVQITEGDQRRADRLLLATSTMSGRSTRRCKKVEDEIEKRLGRKEAKVIRQEVYDAIFDLTPFSREWR